MGEKVTSSVEVCSCQRISSPTRENRNKLWPELHLQWDMASRKSQCIPRKSFHGHLAMWNARAVDLRQCFQTQMEIGDVAEVWENLSRVYSLAQPSPGPPPTPPTPPSLSRLSLCLFEPACHSHRPSLIIEDGLPVSWAAPSLPRPHHWMPVPQASEAHLALQPWLRAQALLGMDVHNLRASLVNPAFFYSLSPVYVWCTASHSSIRRPAFHK